MNKILVIGGGFSGTMTALRLSQLGVASRVTLVDDKKRVGKGVAYSTDESAHLLNVPVGRMSAFAENPSHFYDWLKDPVNRIETQVDPTSFVPRRYFGRYLSSLLETEPADGIDKIFSTVLSIKRVGDAFLVTFENGSEKEFQGIVLALGNIGIQHVHSKLKNIQPEKYICDPWREDSISKIKDTDDILLIGSGLTMIDYATTFLLKQHKGALTAISRHGLLPSSHGPVSESPVCDLSKVSGLRPLLKSIRREIKRIGDFRRVIDSLRPTSHTIWASFSTREKRQFLNHCRSYWGSGRHRMAPEIASIINNALDVNALTVHAGRISNVDELNDKLVVKYYPRGQSSEKTIKVDKVVNCTGRSEALKQIDDALLTSLFAAGEIIEGPVGIGLMTDTEGRCMNQDGNVSTGLYTLGSMRQGMKWESTAVPEIRVQAYDLAQIIKKDLL